MIHRLPQVPVFRDVPPDSPISELALRVVAELDDWELHILGTATLIAGNLAITARHVLGYAVQTYEAKRKSDKHAKIDKCALRLYQQLPGPVYRIWSVETAWVCPSDIAVLHLRLWGTTSDGEERSEWKQPYLRVMPPPVGEKVVAFGYRESKASVSLGNAGEHHIEVTDRPTVAAGIVTQVYPSGRDRGMLPFPCFAIEARFDAGMSGGMVIDETGAVCGLICASLKTSGSTPPVSYVAALWPMLRTVISANRGERYPRGVDYPMIDLAIDGLIAVRDLSALDPRACPGKALPPWTRIT